jgi:hypothetical protein
MVYLTLQSAALRTASTETHDLVPGLALMRYTRGYAGLATCHIRQVICRILPHSASKLLGHYMLQIILVVDLPFEAVSR